METEHEETEHEATEHKATEREAMVPLKFTALVDGLDRTHIILLKQNIASLDAMIIALAVYPNHVTGLCKRLEKKRAHMHDRCEAACATYALAGHAVMQYIRCSRMEEADIRYFITSVCESVLVDTTAHEGSKLRHVFIQNVDYIQTFIQTGHENMSDKDKHLLTTKIEEFKKVFDDMCQPKTIQHETIVGLVCK
jgi:hypothetical protein